jgi:hypothetical protein
MRFIIGKTACAACGLPIDVADDYLAINPLMAAGLRWSGFFHRPCFSLLPDAADLTRRWAAYSDRLVRSRPAYLPEIARTPRLVCFHRLAERSIGLTYLGWCAEQEFKEPAELAEFAGLVGGDELRAAEAAGGPALVTSAGGAFQVRFAADPPGVWLTWGDRIAREVEYADQPFEAHAAAHGPLAGFVDFAALAQQGLRPCATDGDLARCEGVVTRIDSTKAGYRVVYSARRPVTIGLGADGLCELRNLVAEVEKV